MAQLEAEPELRIYAKHAFAKEQAVFFETPSAQLMREALSATSLKRFQVSAIGCRVSTNGKVGECIDIKYSHDDETLVRYTEKLISEFVVNRDETELVENDLYLGFDIAEKDSVEFIRCVVVLLCGIPTPPPPEPPPHEKDGMEAATRD
ncbi:hypothetical protein [Erythrobacter sp.]|jgi:hypothetical protein|uniref:hypothetical protein n=1 Tax=Erythrobacter sp. TaxID=1042 RepID=UPI002ECCAA00|nr:hypothetical protein [Erythrobacter sp.]